MYTLFAECLDHNLSCNVYLKKSRKCRGKERRNRKHTGNKSCYFGAQKYCERWNKNLLEEKYVEKTSFSYIKRNKIEILVRVFLSYYISLGSFHFYFRDENCGMGIILIPRFGEILWHLVRSSFHCFNFNLLQFIF